MKTYFTLTLLGCCTLFGAPVAATAQDAVQATSQATVITTDLPDWLQQVAAEKRRQPEAMLALLQQHQHKLDSLNPQQQAYYYYLQAAIFDGLGRHQQQQQAAEQGLVLLGEEQSALKVKLWYELGFAREMQTDYQAALAHYQQGIALATLLEDKKQLLMGQINQAAIFSAQNQQQQALALLQDVYQRAMRLNDTELSAEINGELGLLYASLAYEEEAVELLQNALSLYEQLGWQKNQITVLFNLARTYSFLQRYELSLQTYNKMLQKSLQMQDFVNLYHAYLGLAITSSDSGRSDAALSYISKAEEYLPQLQSSSHMSTHYYEKALIYRKLKQTSLALQQVMLYESSLTGEGIAVDSPTRLNVWYLKAQLLADQGEYQRAYQQLHDFVFAFQEERNKENELAIEQMRLNFDHERQLQLQRLLEQDNELKALRLEQAGRDRQLQFLWLGILGCTTLVLLILLLWQLTRRTGKNTAAGADSPVQTG
ncbi:tetratricopeptide repeat protein [Rheinheimera sp. NSM]|uniref:tetratricopeptide repeat protein n=1 Tax=Rheinheimera sp. NSM TaxID=3457884 RepID=UPI0040366C68